MWENIVERDRPQMTIWRMPIACRPAKATDTHSEYVILNCFSKAKSVPGTRPNVTLFVNCLSFLLIEACSDARVSESALGHS